MGILLDLRVVTKFPKVQFKWLGETLKIWVKQPPEKGKANKEITRIFSKIDPDARIISGLKSSRKKILLPNTDLARLKELVNAFSK